MKRGEERRAGRKRGGGTLRVSLSEAVSFTGDRGADLVALDEALTALAKVDPRKGQVVEMRFFGGCRSRKWPRC